jgi:hypothetical protein
MGCVDDERLEVGGKKVRVWGRRESIGGRERGRGKGKGEREGRAPTSEKPREREGEREREREREEMKSDAWEHKSSVELARILW